MTNQLHLTLVKSNKADEQKSVGQTHYVRVRSTDRPGFVEFDFAIDDPTLFVELILPTDAFNAFCENNNVVEMDQDQAAVVDEDAAKWRYGNDDRSALNEHDLDD